MGILPGRGSSFDEQREWLLRNVSQEIWETQSGNSILEDLRSQGFQMRRSNFQAVRREALSLYKYQEQIERLGDDKTIPERFQIEGIYPGQKTTKLYQIEVTGWDSSIEPDDRNDENISKRYISLASSVELTKGEIISQIDSALETFDSRYDFEPQSAQVFRAITTRG